MAWVALALIALAAMAVDFCPTVTAGVAGVASLCAPAPSPSHARVRDIAVAQAPRCGVA
jgi:hypothetical protein